MKILGTLALAGALMASAAANARLQISISDGINPVFSCFDGELSCDLSGGANNLLTLDTTVGSFFVQGTLSMSTAGAENNLSLSTFSAVNNGGTEGTLKILVSDTGFLNPVSSIQSSGSLTFNQNVGAGNSLLQFWADPANVQGANPINTPGSLLFTASGAAATAPDSFSGTHDSLFALSAPFSMTEGTSLDLLAGGSVTGFNQDMLTSPAIPEASTWAMMLAGFGLLGFLARRKDAVGIA
jgi:hypothetical protein